jgi:probable rRNA maturation factor
MILLDPELDPDPAPYASAAKRASAFDQAVNPVQLRIPSERLLARFLREAQAAVRLRGQVTVLLTTDAGIRSLNRRFRGKNKTTDVLSFPAEGFGLEKIAGDLAISVPVARKQAAEQGHPLATEIKVLMLHGLLHLAGYDHETDSGEMARRERVLRARLKLPLGLIERTEDDARPARKATAGPLRQAQSMLSTPAARAASAQDDSENKTRRIVRSQVRRKNPPRRAPNPGHPEVAGRSNGRRREP